VRDLQYRFMMDLE